MPQTATPTITTPTPGALQWVTETADDVLIDPPDDLIIDPDDQVTITPGTDLVLTAPTNGVADFIFSHDENSDDGMRIEFTSTIDANANIQAVTLAATHVVDVASSITQSGQSNGFRLNCNKTGDGTLTRLNALRAQSIVTAGTLTNIFGFSGVIDVRNTSSVGTAYGLHAALNTSGTPTITTAYGTFIAAPTGSPTITTLYGLYIEGTTIATTNWGVYCDGDQPHHLNGVVHLGNSSGGNGQLRVYATSGNQLNCRSAGGNYDVGVDNSSGDVTCDAPDGKMVLDSADGVQIGTLTGADQVKRIAQELVTLTAPASVPANSTRTFTHTMTASTVDSSTRISVAMRSVLNSGLAWDHTYNAGTRVLTIRYHNVTGSAIVPSDSTPTFDILKFQF